MGRRLNASLNFSFSIGESFLNVDSVQRSQSSLVCFATSVCTVIWMEIVGLGYVKQRQCMLLRLRQSIGCDEIPRRQRRGTGSTRP